MKINSYDHKNEIGIKYLSSLHFCLINENISGVSLIICYLC